MKNKSDNLNSIAGNDIGLNVSQQRGKFSKRFVNSILIVSVSLSVVFLFELSLRFFWHNPYKNESPDHILKLPIHHPGTDHLIDRSLINSVSPTVRFRTDERSYILPSRRFENPEKTIVFFGGSTTECIAVEESLRFHVVVSKLLENKGLKVNTLNIGRSGNTTHDALNLLLNHVVLDKPDIAVLMNASNDMGVINRDSAYRSRMGQKVNVVSQLKWQVQILSNYSYFIAFLRYRLSYAKIQPGERGNDMTVVPEPFSYRLQAFISLCRAFKIEPVLMTQPVASFRTEVSPHWLESGTQKVFNNVIREIGLDQNISVIDLVQHVNSHDDASIPMKIFYDGMHVTDFGSRVYAEYITEALSEKLLQR